MSRLTLAKYHGLGNDFLILLGPEPAALADLARQVCDRKRGIGADGLIVGVAEANGVRMILHNADGSRAELSGNGLRCLAHAVLRARGELAGTVLVTTDVGVRRADVTPGSGPGSVQARVEMGNITEIAPPPRWPALGIDPLRPVAHLSIGNPHAVVLTDHVDSIDLAAAGALVPDVNLEVIACGPERDAITMRVHERGAGITEACGTGACAAAYAARGWGLARNGAVTVHMVGGDARVEIAADGAVALSGPSTYVATVEIDAP
jgi:diaminopimelate epimerase